MKRVAGAVLTALLIAFTLAGCSQADENRAIVVETPMTLSDSICAFNGKTAYLRLKMVKGRYYEDWNPGAIMGTIWEGYYTAELADEYGETISQTDFSEIFNSGKEPLVFRFSFEIEFDDYNADGDPDFTVGQYSSSNGRDYRLFTIRKDGKVEPLPVKDYPSLFISDTTGYYSTKLIKVDETTFKRAYYDNSVGEQFENHFKWDGAAFVKVPGTHR